MKFVAYIFAFMLIAQNSHAKPVEMTGLHCVRSNAAGVWVWEFYGDVAMRYASDGSRSRLHRVGEGAYEKYGKDGEWTSTYYFFEKQDGIYLRILARPGLIAREENPRAPLLGGIVPLDADCVPLGFENDS